MAATTSQGKTFTLFMVAITAACAGIAYFSTASGKLALVIGLLGLGISALSFIKIKPQEGKTGYRPQPLALISAGVVSVLAGWGVVLFGIHLTSSVGGRMVTSLLGLAISLVGMLVLLPMAANKNALWKA